MENNRTATIKQLQKIENIALKLLTEKSHFNFSFCLSLFAVCIFILFSPPFFPLRRLSTSREWNRVRYTKHLFRIKSFGTFCESTNQSDGSRFLCTRVEIRFINYVLHFSPIKYIWKSGENSTWIVYTQ